MEGKIAKTIENNKEKRSVDAASGIKVDFPPMPFSREGLSDRLQAILGEESQTSFARKIGIAQTTLSSYLTGGTEPSWSVLMRIAQISGRSIGWLMAGADELSSSQSKQMQVTEMTAPDLVPVPVHRVDDGDAPCLVVKVDPSLTRMFDRPPAQGLCFVLPGDTSAPTAARGDVIMIDPTMRDLREGGVFALDMSGDVVIRRVERQADLSVILHADNSAYASWHVAGSAVVDLHVVGRVRWTLRAM